MRKFIITGDGELRSLITTGNIVNGDFAYHTMPDTLDVMNDWLRPR